MALHERLSTAQDMNPGEVHLKLKIPIGASGAVGTVDGFGVVSVAKNTTGVYDITLDRGYVKLLYFDGSCIAATGALNHPVLKTDYTSGSTTLQFQTVVQAGTATEPANGDTILLDIVFDKTGLV